MSTIVFRDGIMAADTRAYVDGNHVAGRKTKIRLIGDLLVGVSSVTTGTPERFFRAIERGVMINQHGLTIDYSPEGDLGRFNVLVVDKDWNGYMADDSAHFSGPIRGPYFAIGSGWHYAAGALEFGACAVDAVRVSTRLDVWSTLPIDCLKHSGQAWQVDA